MGVVVKEEKKRSFGGKLFVPKDGKVRSLANRMEKQFEEKHLKAYLRGDTRFSFGKDEYNHPVFFDVKVILV